MPTATRTRRPRFGSIVASFKEFLVTRDQAQHLSGHQDELRLKLLDEIEAKGRQDDDGHIWLTLDEPIEFTDHTGKTHVYTELKNQLSLVPARPQPDLEKAEELLKKKGLWLTTEQLKLIRRLVSTLPLFDVTVELNPERFGDLVFSKQITDKEYRATLQEQTQKISFVQVEEK